MGFHLWVLSLGHFLVEQLPTTANGVGSFSISKYVRSRDHLAWSNRSSVPVGIVSWIFIVVALPANFPHQPSEDDPDHRLQIWPATKSFFSRVDIIGSLFTLAACSFIIAALQEGNSEYSWNSGLVIAFFVISGVSTILFILWEWLICHRDLGIIAMFPWWLVRNRVFMGVVLYVFSSPLLPQSPTSLPHFQKDLFILNDKFSLAAFLRLVFHYLCV